MRQQNYLYLYISEEKSEAKKETEKGVVQLPKDGIF